MNRSPDRLNFDHLKKQAKDLIRSYRKRRRRDLEISRGAAGGGRPDRRGNILPRTPSA
jgi:hypothetical protein